MRLRTLACIGLGALAAAKPGQHRDNPEEESRKQAWLVKPLLTDECNKSDGEGTANHVVRTPANPTLTAFLRRGSDIGMPKDPFWHGSDPASDQTDVRWRNVEGTFEKDRPKVKGEGCTEPNQDGTNEGER